MKQLASTMKVQLFDNDNNLVVNSDTLTSSVVNFSGEEIESTGGQGNKTLNVFNHSGKLEITLTDNAFSLEYIAMKVGSNIEFGANVFTNEAVKLTTGGVGTLVGTPVEFGGELCLWAKRPNTKGMPIKLKIDKTTKQFTYPNGVEDEEICVTYVNFNENAKKLVIPANFVPKTLHLVGTVMVYEDGEWVDNFIIDVPKYKLTSTLELSMEASGLSSTDISGKALAVESNTCDGNAVYGEAYLEGKSINWKDEVTAIIADTDELELSASETQTVSAIAVFNTLTENKEVKASDLVFSIPADASTIATVDDNGLVTAVGTGSTTLTVSLKDRDDLVDTVPITIA